LRTRPLSDCPERAPCPPLRLPSPPALPSPLSVSLPAHRSCCWSRPRPMPPSSSKSARRGSPPEEEVGPSSGRGRECVRDGVCAREGVCWCIYGEGVCGKRWMIDVSCVEPLFPRSSSPRPPDRSSHSSPWPPHPPLFQLTLGSTWTPRPPPGRERPQRPTAGSRRQSQRTGRGSMGRGVMLPPPPG
jgi:hypothetical protein